MVQNACCSINSKFHWPYLIIKTSTSKIYNKKSFADELSQVDVDKLGRSIITVLLMLVVQVNKI